MSAVLDPATLAETSTGRSFPLGASFVPGGVNFSVFSRNALGVELLLFDWNDDSRPARVIPIDPVANRTYHYWHVLVLGIEPGQLYGYRVHGPSDPASGLRFDFEKVLLDPYARGVVVPATYSRDAARFPGDNTSSAMKSVVVDSAGYDWEGDTPLRHPSSRTIIYEMHVRGKEWNGRFRDAVRAFFRSEDDTTGRFADRFLGSPGDLRPQRT